MPPVIKNTITFGTVSGIARDNVIWDLVVDNPTSSILTNIQNLLNLGPLGGTHALSYWLSDVLSRTANHCSIKQTDITAHLAGGASGPPFLTSTFTLGVSGGGNSLPSEVATVLTYHALYDSIPEHAPAARPRSRYRGRVYVGPLIASCLNNDTTTHRPILSPALLTDATKAFNAFLTAEPGWSVWSRKDGQARHVVAGWMDDAFDSQRRRKEDHLARTMFP